MRNIPSAVVMSALCLAAPAAEARTDPAWSLRSESGPSPRADHAMAYDAARQRIVLFGGYDGSTFWGDTWEWDGARWELRATTGPSARAYHAMAYDAARERVVIFGGGPSFSPGGRLADTWEWDGTSWTQRDIPGPSERAHHAMAYDVARGRVVLFGGNAFIQTVLGDAWEWDGTSWTEIPGGPQARLGHAMAYNGRVVLFGGWTSGYLGDTWEWNGSAWTQRASTGPSARYEHAMAFDAFRARVVVFGGKGSFPGYLGDTWEWDGAAWQQRASAGPSARWNHGMAYDAARGRVVLFGGYDGAYTRDTWEWLPSAPPPPCQGDANGDGMVDFGDITSVLANFGNNYSPGTGPGDANGNGVVNFADVAEVLVNFGAACG